MSEKITHQGHARSPEKKNVLEDLQSRGVCNFCQGEHFLEGHSSPVLIETKHWVATKNRWAYEGATSHLLVINKEHLTTVTELSSDAWEDLQKITLKLVEEFNITGGTFLLRFGDMRFNGSTVQHLHAQIVSGNGTKKVITRIG